MKATVNAALGAMLYGAAALFASPAAAELSADEIASLKAARAGDMTKLVIHNEPRPALDHGFETRTGAVVGFDRFHGKVAVVNFWATWCPPCRKEMPSIDRLNAAISGDDFVVAAIALDRSGVGKIEEFFLHEGIENLTIYREPTMRLGAAAGVLGMPITIILDREGREIARYTGEAVWDSPEARDILSRIKTALDGDGA